MDSFFLRFFFYILTGHAFEDLIDILFFESWLNNRRLKKKNPLKTFYARCPRRQPLAPNSGEKNEVRLQNI